MRTAIDEEGMMPTTIGQMLSLGVATHTRAPSSDAVSLSAALADSEAMTSRIMRLQEVTAALSKARTEEEVARIVLGMGLPVIESTTGVLARVDGECFERIATVGFPPELEAQVLAMTRRDECPLTHVARSGQQLWLSSPEQHRAYSPFLYERLGIAPPQASATVPLRHGSEIVGAFVMFFADASAFGAAKQAFTLVLAQVAADALARARSYDLERDARRGAETLAQARADVLGIVAHDLRNPLSVISASCSTLLELDEMTPAQRRRMLELAQRAVRRMNRMIGDLLDATQLQAGRLSLELADIDACKVMREAQETLAAAAEERHIELCAHPPKHECWVRADEGRLLQVIGNLVGNALKFSAEGGRVTLSAEPGELEVVFKVADDGPGIPPEHQAQLFDSFWQARTADRRGVGLGLSITKDIIDALAGRLWVESMVGAGSTFSFALPSVRTAQDMPPMGVAVSAPRTN